MGDMTGNDTAGEQYMKPATRLRKLLSQPGVCIQAPGVYDGICARLAIEQGFQVMVCLDISPPSCLVVATGIPIVRS
jgi:hypothetical protein